jgi:hypothetical protein
VRVFSLSLSNTCVAARFARTKRAGPSLHHFPPASLLCTQKQFLHASAHYRGRSIEAAASTGRGGRRMLTAAPRALARLRLLASTPLLIVPARALLINFSSQRTRLQPRARSLSSSTSGMDSHAPATAPGDQAQPELPPETSPSGQEEPEPTLGSLPQLDREAFKSELPLTALRVPVRKCAELMRAFRGWDPRPAPIQHTSTCYCNVCAWSPCVAQAAALSVLSRARFTLDKPRMKCIEADGDSKATKLLLLGEGIGLEGTATNRYRAVRARALPALSSPQLGGAAALSPSMTRTAPLEDRPAL